MILMQAKHEQHKAVEKAQQMKQMVKLLDKKVEVLKGKVADIADDHAKMEKQLKEHLVELTKKKLAMNKAKQALDGARGEYDAQSNLVDETRDSVESNSKELARLRVELLKAEDESESTKLNAQQAAEARHLADREAAETLRNLKQVAVKNMTGSNATNTSGIMANNSVVDANDYERQQVYTLEFDLQH